jgi:hypothetical protein
MPGAPARGALAVCARCVAAIASTSSGRTKMLPVTLPVPASIHTIT